jgi:hypothetical protein
LAHGGFAAANAQEALQQKLAALNGAVIVGRLREHLRKEVGERREEKDARGTRKRHENKRVRKHKPELRYFKIIHFFFHFIQVRLLSSLSVRYPANSYCIEALTSW